MEIIEKHRAVIRDLEDDELYSPSQIAKRPGVAGPDRTRLLRGLRRMSRLKKFPADGDGLVYIHGQAPITGWYGKRWKASLPKTGNGDAGRGRE